MFAEKVCRHNLQQTEKQNEAEDEDDEEDREEVASCVPLVRDLMQLSCLAMSKQRVAMNENCAQ